MSQKRKVIQQAALELFLQQGFSKTSMEMIKKRAGVAKQTLYNYYPSKQQLFIDMIRLQVDKVVDQIWEIEIDKLKFSDLSQVQQFFREFAHAMVQVLAKPAYLNLLLTLFSEVKHFPELGEMFAQAVPYRNMKKLVRVLEKTNHEGLTRVEHPEEAIRMFIGGLLTYAILNGLLFNQEVNEKRLMGSVDAIVGYLMKIVKD
jgi:AcrR family transcriptional regulator